MQMSSTLTNYTPVYSIGTCLSCVVCASADLNVVGPLLDAHGRCGNAAAIASTVLTIFTQCKQKPSAIAAALMSERARRSFVIAASVAGDAHMCDALLAGGKQVRLFVRYLCYDIGSAMF